MVDPDVRLDNLYANLAAQYLTAPHTMSVNLLDNKIADTDFQ